MFKRRVRQLPKVSAAAMAYLESPEFQETFCGKCQWNEYHEGFFDEVTGFGEPPHNTCPAEFDIFDPECMQRDRLRDIMEFLREADEVWM